MGAAAENLDLGHGQHDFLAAGQVAPQWHTLRAGGCVQYRHRYGNGCIAAKSHFVLGPVEPDQCVVNFGLIL